jgi:phage baseplate assembly protein W
VRRIVAQIKRRHWSAIAVELMIVVLGVFMGMQVSNWNQVRIADQQAAIFTTHLKADLREEDWRYQFLVAYNQEVLANANRAVDALDGTSTLPDESLLVSSYRATQYKQGLRRRSTYDELISTGTIGLIRDQRLRDTAMRLYNVQTFENMVQEGMRSRFREAFRMSMPNDVQRALARQCGDRYIRPGDYASIHGILDYPCSTGLSKQVITESATALRSNAELVPLLRLRIADIETRLVDLTGNNRNILENLRVIANE